MPRKQFTDRSGRTWRPDPTGRFAFRVVEGDRWTAEVCMVRGQEPGSDPEGELLLAAGVGQTMTPDDPRSDVFAGLDQAALDEAVRPAPGMPEDRAEADRPIWRHQVLATTGAGLQAWLDDQGRAGWELVSILQAPASSADDLIAVFKRPD